MHRSLEIVESAVIFRDVVQVKRDGFRLFGLCCLLLLFGLLFGNVGSRFDLLWHHNWLLLGFLRLDDGGLNNVLLLLSNDGRLFNSSLLLLRHSFLLDKRLVLEVKLERADAGAVIHSESDVEWFLLRSLIERLQDL